MRTAIIATLFVASCSSLNPLAETKLTNDFADRAIEVNEAYSAERSAQILINVLRARDDLPRKYTSLSDLKVTPGSTNETKVDASAIKLGNNGIDPWVTLGGSRSLTNTSNLELAVSPRVSGADSKSVFRSAISAELFQYYYDSGWNKELVRSLLIDRYDKFFDANSAPGNIAALNQISGAKAPFRVYAMNGTLYHCFQPTDCPTEIHELNKAKPGGEPQNVLVTNLKQRASTAEMLSFSKRAAWADNEWAKAERSTGSKAVSDEESFFFYCVQTGVAQNVTLDASADSVKVHKANKYECSRTPPANTLCSKWDDEKNTCNEAHAAPVAVYWIGRGPPGYSGQSEQRAVYQVRLRAIDDVIYFVGKSLRGQAGCSSDSGMLACSEPALSMGNGKFTGPLFAVTTPADLKSKACERMFAADVQYSDGRRYLAGPPEIFSTDSSIGSAGESCRFAQRSGTVLTLISELIEAVEVPPVLPATSIVIR